MKSFWWIITSPVAEIPTVPLNVTVDAERTSRGGNTVIRLGWMRPPNFDQFDIDRYDISVTSTSGIQNMTTACGQCTNAVITVSENPNNVQMNTTFTINISAINLCGETGPTGTASYTLSKLPLFMYILYINIWFSLCSSCKTWNGHTLQCHVYMSIYCTYLLVLVSLRLMYHMLSDTGVSHQAIYFLY